MRQLITAIATLLIGIGLSPLARADEATQSSKRMKKMEAKMEERFANADTNHDGKLTKEEATGKMPRVAKNFDQIDSGNAGYVTLDQMREFAAGKIQERNVTRQ